MITLLGERVNRAKKPYKCGLCGLEINPGGLYIRQSCTDDGNFYMFKSHIECNKLIATLKGFSEIDDGISSDDFVEIIEDEFNSLTSGFKAKLEFIKDIYL